MDDVVLMRIVETLGDRDQDLDLARQGHRISALDHLVEILAVQELLDDVGDAVLDAKVVDGRDVAVMEGAGQLRLPKEPALDLLVVKLAGLDGDRPFDERIPALVDGSKAARADLLGDLVFPDFLWRSHRMTSKARL